MSTHDKLDYVEFAAADISATKAFFEAAFGWTFEDYGPDYTAFSNQGINGGFYRAELSSKAQQGGALLVFYSAAISETLERVKQNGGCIVRDIFDFPGGCRFHFSEPSGNDFAVWSESR